jgi:hypothetical protein
MKKKLLPAILIVLAIASLGALVSTSPLLIENGTNKIQHSFVVGDGMTVTTSGTGTITATPPTGTGYRRVVGGAEDAAARSYANTKVDLGLDLVSNTSDATKQTANDARYGLLSGTLAQFGATTSAQLLGVISDETGTGLVVANNGPNLIAPILGTPASGVLTNATGLPEAGLSFTDISTANATTSLHGLLPKLGGGTTNFLRADGTWQAPPGSGTISSGTTNTLPKYTAATTIGNSLFTDDGTTGKYTGSGGFSLTGSSVSGKLTLSGITSGSTIYTTADATAQTVTITTAAQTSGAANLTIPNFAGVNDTYTFNTLAATLANKTLASPIVTGTLTANTGTNLIGPLVDSVDGTTPLNNIIQTVAAGTAYTMTASYADVTFGTTSPTVTLANAGTYSVYVDIQFSLVGASYATYQSASAKLRRQNNTPADLPDSTFGTFIPTITTITAVGPLVHIGPIKYTTAATTDVITVQAVLSATPSVGSVTATNCTITAIRAY